MREVRRGGVKMRYTQHGITSHLTFFLIGCYMHGEVLQMDVTIHPFQKHDLPGGEGEAERGRGGGRGGERGRGIESPLLLGLYLRSSIGTTLRGGGVVTEGGGRGCY